jgi:peptide/nickel transport system substrate-binding protein
MRPCPVLAVLLLVAASGCDVDRDPTPHRKDQAERRRRQRELAAAQDGGAPDGGVASVVPRERRLVIAIDEEPRHLNPLLEISPWGYRIAMYNVYEPLVRRDPVTHEVVPHLATSWTVSEDGRVYRFTLRRDVTWHDGAPLTARDVWYTIGRIHDKDTAMGTFRDDFVNEFHQVDPLTPHEVRITLARANSYLLDHLCELPILPFHLFGRSVTASHKHSLQPVGSGPFRFDGWTRAKEIRLLANPRYWGGVPEVQEVVFRLLPDDAKALTELNRGAIDILPQVAREHYPEQITAWTRKRFQEVWFDPPGFSFILWNTRHPVLSDFRVRRALTMLIDRPRILKEVHHGLARAIAGPFWRPAGLGDPKLEPWPYDPVKARNLLDNAGWRDRDGDQIRDQGDTPLRLVLLRPVTSAVMDDELKMMVGEFKRSGVDLEAVQTDWRRMAQLLRSRRFVGAALSFRGRPVEDLGRLLHSAGAQNHGGQGSLAMDRLLGHMRTALGRRVRAEASAEIERILASAEPFVFLHAPRVLSLVHRRLAGVQASPEWLRLDRLKLVPFDDPVWRADPEPRTGGAPGDEPGAAPAGVEDPGMGAPTRVRRNDRDMAPGMTPGMTAPRSMTFE